jgi:hypothetical protein
VPSLVKRSISCNKDHMGVTPTELPSGMADADALKTCALSPNCSSITKFEGKWFTFNGVKCNAGTGIEDD